MSILWTIGRFIIRDTGTRELLGIPHDNWTYELENTKCEQCHEKLYHSHSKCCVKCFENRKESGRCCDCAKSFVCQA